MSELYKDKVYHSAWDTAESVWDPKSFGGFLYSFDRDVWLRSMISCLKTRKTFKKSYTFFHFCSFLPNTK